MEQNQVTINELAVNFIAEMRRIGYSEVTIYRNIFRSVRHVVKYYETAGITFYSLEATAELVKLYSDRREWNEISDAYLRQIRSITNRMNEFYITGTLRINANKHGTKLATTSSTGGLLLALQRAIVTARPEGRYRKRSYWSAIKRYL